MRAIDSSQGGVFFNDDAPDPHEDRGEALLRVRCAALGRDERLRLPDDGIPGRLFVGTIERSDDDRFARGDRVVGKPHIRCGDCDLCRGGLGDHCRNGLTLGEQGLNGCLAEFVSMPIENLELVPEGVDDDAAVFAWTLAGAIHVAHMLRLSAGSYVTVLGDNAEGFLCAQWLQSLNASVRLLGRCAQRFELCEKWGVKHRHADDVGRRGDQDAVIDCTGSDRGLKLAMQLVRPRGTIVVRSRAPGVVDLEPLAERELTLMGSRVGDLPAAVGALLERRVDVLSLITRRIRLQDVPGAIDAPPGESDIQTVVEV